MSQDDAAPGKTGSALQGAVAGVIAGLASRLVTFPADTLKARLQVVGALESSLSNSSSAQQPAATSTPPARKITGEKRWGPPVATAARLLWRREGLPGFFRGFGAVAVGTAPGQAAYFGGYECGKMIVPERYGLLGDMGVGCIAQLFAGVAFTPIDIIKERLQVQSLLPQRGPHAAPSGMIASVRSILNQSGPLGLFRGYWATNCVWLPWNIIYIALYEAEKRSATEWLQVPAGQPLPPGATMACAFTAASVAAVATHPPDVIKTRLQVLSGQGGNPVTVVGLTKQLLRNEGPRAFFSGLGARIAMMGPGAAVSWAVYEQTKLWLAQNW